MRVRAYARGGMVKNNSHFPNLDFTNQRISDSTSSPKKGRSLFEKVPSLLKQSRNFFQWGRQPLTEEHKRGEGEGEMGDNPWLSFSLKILHRSRKSDGVFDWGISRRLEFTFGDFKTFEINFVGVESLDAKVIREIGTAYATQQSGIAQIEIANLNRSLSY